MSRPGRMKVVIHSIKTDKEVLTKVLQAYKDNPCLWDNCHPDYNNREYRKEAQEKLLKIYKTLEPDAEISEVKKKIDNMRSSGKRYFKKKLEAKSKGKPFYCTLWYYDLIKFLYRDNDEDTCIDDDYSDELRKKSMSSDGHKSDSVDIKDEFELSEEFEANASTSFVGDRSVASPSGSSNDRRERKRKFSASKETKHFGASIDKQLSEVHPEQKNIAEKLITQIVYLAKMDKLTAATDISLKSFDPNS